MCQLCLNQVSSRNGPEKLNASQAPCVILSNKEFWETWQVVLTLERASDLPGCTFVRKSRFLDPSLPEVLIHWIGGETQGLHFKQTAQVMLIKYSKTHSTEGITEGHYPTADLAPSRPLGPELFPSHSLLDHISDGYGSDLHSPI